MVADLLRLGKRLTNRQIQEICGYANESSASKLMRMLSRKLPYHQSDGVWEVVSMDKE